MTREPLLDQRPAPTSDRDSAARGLHVNDANLALGHEVFEAAGATFVRDTRFPDIHVSIALIYEKLELLRTARVHWRRYLQLEPAGSWSRVARQRLEDEA